MIHFIKKKVLGWKVAFFKSFWSVSGASSSDQLLRTGNHFEINYLKDWTTKLDWVGSVTTEKFQQKNPGLEVPNAKFFAIGDVYYHFSQFGESKINPYLGVGLGIGYSLTSISKSTSKGYAMILPALKAGFQTVAEKQYLLIEGVIESVSSTETFESGQNKKQAPSTPKRP